MHMITAFVGLFLLFSTVVLINTATADESGTRANSISHSPNDAALTSLTESTSSAEIQTEYISPAFTAEFPFNGIGLTWSGPASAMVEFALAIDNADWQKLEMQGEDAKDAVEYFTSAPLFASGQTVRYRITGTDVAQIRNVRLVYFDSTTAPQHSLLSSLSRTLKHSIQTDNPVIISREEWGADDSYLTWGPQYSTPKKIIIHHTAGGNGDDAAATIRGIYYWHAIILGWGDIGYNYLIDQQGNIYEGRSGGFGVIGAHTYNENTETNYNVGSVGISLLGCFESSNDACASVADYTETIDTSLTDLISAVAHEADFDPAGTKKWYGEKTPNIIGHRDVDYTYCPGTVVYDELDAIRVAARNKYALLQSATPRQRALWQNATVATDYSSTDEPTISVTYTNAGLTTWRPQTTALQWSVLETGQQQRVELTEAIAFNNSATLSAALAILPKQTGHYTLISKLYRKGRVIPGSTHQYPINLTAAYQANHVTLTLPIAIQAGWTPQLDYSALNAGSYAWPAGTALVINDEPVKTLKQSIKPGEMLSVTTAFAQAANLSPGNLMVKAMLQLPDESPVPGSRVTQSLRID